MNLIVNKEIIKIIFFLIPIFFIFKLPISDFFDFFWLIFLITIFFSTTKFNQNFEFNFFCIILLILLFLIYFLDDKKIIEKNGIFLPNEHNISKYYKYDKNLFKYLKQKFNQNYFNKNIKCKTKNNCWEHSILDNIFSTNFNLSNNSFKKINKIHHDDLSSANIGMINNISLNWYDWQNKIDIKRSNAPYFIIYNFNSDIYNKSKICWKGNAIIINENLNHIYNDKINCFNTYKNLEILLYNFDSNLEISLKKNINLTFFSYLILLIKIISLLIFLKIFINKINPIKFFKILIILTLSSFYIIYIYYRRQIFEYGYFPLEGGMDGLTHEGFGKIMTNYLSQLNFTEFLRGVENQFYYMPGLRYILSLINVFFANTFIGIILILIFFPVTIYFVFLKLGFKERFSFFIVCLFILVKIPYIGFSFDHFARGGLTIYPETFASFFFFIFLILFLTKNYFLSALVCSIMVFIRPNYLPIFFIYLLYHFYIFLLSYNFDRLLKTLFGMLFFLLVPLHNLFFGIESFAFLTTSAYISNNLRVDFIDYLNFFIKLESKKIIIEHLLNWISTGERNNPFPFIINSILFINLFYFNISKIKNFDNKFFLICFFALGQQFVLFFYSNTDRYAYFPWLLVLISNLIIFNYYYKVRFIKFFKKLYK